MTQTAKQPTKNYPACKELMFITSGDTKNSFSKLQNILVYRLQHKHVLVSMFLNPSPDRLSLMTPDRKVNFENIMKIGATKSAHTISFYISPARVAQR